MKTPQPVTHLATGRLGAIALCLLLTAAQACSLDGPSCCCAFAVGLLPLAEVGVLRRLAGRGRPRAHTELASMDHLGGANGVGVAVVV